ncbi:hypothetical protein Tco_0768222, partial [Tanacetum coccineum]
MAWFEQLETHLRDLYLNSSSYVVDAFKPAFHSFFGEEHQTFRVNMLHNLDQLRLQLERDNLLKVNPRTCLEALQTQFKEFFASKRVRSSEHLNQCWQKYFKEYTLCEPNTYRRDLLETLDTLEAVIHRAIITYGKLQLQSQDVQINPVQAVDDSLIVSKSNIRLVIDKVPFAEVQLTAQHIVPANEQQHTEQSEPIYDTYLLEKINDLKAQLQAKTTLICNLKNQIKSVKEASNEVKVKHDIDVLETINIELESSVAKLLAENENLNKENKHLKQTYKELYNSIKRQNSEERSIYDSLICSKVNSRAKVQSPKTRNNTKPVEPKSHTQKPSRQIAIGQRFSPKKSSAVHEKPNTPRSCLRWKPTGRIFKIAGLRWIPTGKMFTDYTTKVDSEPPNGSNDDITNPYECDQTLNVSAVQASNLNVNKMTSVHISSGLALQRQMASADNSSGPYFNHSPSVAQPVLEADVQDTPSTSISQTIKEAQSYVIPTSVEEDDH